MTPEELRLRSMSEKELIQYMSEVKVWSQK